MTERTFASRAEESRFLRLRLERCERDRAELIEALRDMVDVFSSLDVQGACDDARTLLERMK